jgi:hypothetical protein
VFVLVREPLGIWSRPISEESEPYQELNCPARLFARQTKFSDTASMPVAGRLVRAGLPHTENGGNLGGFRCVLSTPHPTQPLCVRWSLQ